MISIIEKAIRTFQSSVEVPISTTEQDVYIAIRTIMRENPDIFWFSHQWEFSEQPRIVTLKYSFGKERAKKGIELIKDVVENDFNINEVRKLTINEQVMYVYKWLALYSKYNIYSAYNQSIYSVFVFRNSVCTGFAKAAQYLFSLLGIESKLVFGKLKNSAPLSRHCWLIVKIGDKWYHIDPTFAIPDTAKMLENCGAKPIYGKDGLIYNYFCVSQKIIEESKEPSCRDSNLIEDNDSLPACKLSLGYEDLQNIRVKVHRTTNQDKLGYKGGLIADNGTTADVFSWHRDDNIQAVIKYYRNDQSNDILLNELLFMTRLADSDHFIQVFGVSEDNNGLIMEQAIPLSDLLSSHYFELSGHHFCQIIIDLIDALQDALDHGIYYRDIHLNNIFRNSKGKYILGDFGSCSFVDNKNEVHDYIIASPWYMAPETFTQQKFNEVSSTYCVGMIAYFILNNLRPPFSDKPKQSSVKIRFQGRTIPVPERLKSISNQYEWNLLEILSKSISYNVADRFQTLQELRTRFVELQNTPDSKVISIYSCMDKKFFAKENHPSCYSQPWTRKSPGHIIFLVDQSQFMLGDKAEQAISIMHSTIIDVVNGCISGTNIKDCVFITIIGYGDNVVEVISEGWVSEYIELLQNLKNNNTPIIPVKAKGSSPFVEALEVTKDICQVWISATQEGERFYTAPVVINISAGIYSDYQKAFTQAHEIMSLSANGSNVRMYNICLNGLTEVSFPLTIDEVSDDISSRFLYSISSTITSEYLHNKKENAKAYLENPYHLLLGFISFGSGVPKDYEEEVIVPPISIFETISEFANSAGCFDFDSDRKVVIDDTAFSACISSNSSDSEGFEPKHWAGFMIGTEGESCLPSTSSDSTPDNWDDWFDCGKNEAKELSESNIRNNNHEPIVWTKTERDKIHKTTFWSRLFGRKNNLQSAYSSVFAPAEIAPKQHLIVQVYLHLKEETEKVKELAFEADKSTERRGYEPLEVKLKKGDNVEIELNINGNSLLYNSRKSGTWQGSFIKRSFDYLVPYDLDVYELSCSVNIFVNGAIAGELIFITSIVDSPRALNTNIIAKPTKRLFISYSHKDIKSAERIAKIHEALGIDVFFDKHRLKAGYIYSEEISRFIQTADTFVLCWSENAAESDYVEKERKEALSLAYPQTKPREQASLRIHPYNIEPHATPPADMIEHYHFEEL